MNLLQLLQRWKRETSIPGPAPATVAGVANNIERGIDWINDTYTEIQNKPRNWKWMRATAVGDITTSVLQYTIDELLGVAAGATRFRRFVSQSQFYRVTAYVDGTPENEFKLRWLPWDDFRQRFLIGAPQGAAPQYWSESPAGKMAINPPDQAYKLRFDYWRSNAPLLAVDSDTPEFPSDFHMVLVWGALNKYGSRLAAPEVVARSANAYEALFGQLDANQGEQIEFEAPSNSGVY